jgi:hypothetical protein
MDVASNRAVLGALETHHVHYVVFGGVALNLQGLARFTEDLDIFIEPTQQNIERLRAALNSVYNDPNIEDITSVDLLGDYPAVQYIPPAGSFHLDILTRLGEAFVYSDLDYERVELLGIQVNVATPQTLYRMKNGTVRPKDWSDAAALKQHFGLGED